MFDSHALTGAHESLPLGTRLLVTMQETGRSVVITIIDRMPPKHTRVIDLSRAAARQLGLLASGVGMVTLSEANNATPVEVAEAEEDDVSPQPHGPRHRHHGARTASPHHGYYHGRSATRAPR